MHQEPYPSLNPEEDDNVVIADARDAEDILIGDDPTKDWTPEQRKQVEEIFATLDKPEEPEKPKIDLRDKFSPGEIIQDPKGLRIAIRTVGTDCMNVELLGGKKGKFVDGYQLSISDLSFVTIRSRKKRTVLQLLGPVLLPGMAPEMKTPGEVNAQEPSTMAKGGNVAEKKEEEPEEDTKSEGLTF